MIRLPAERQCPSLINPSAGMKVLSDTSVGDPPREVEHSRRELPCVLELSSGKESDVAREVRTKSTSFETRRGLSSDTANSGVLQSAHGQ